MISLAMIISENTVEIRSFIIYLFNLCVSQFVKFIQQPSNWSHSTLTHQTVLKIMHTFRFATSSLLTVAKY